MVVAVTACAGLALAQQGGQGGGRQWGGDPEQMRQRMMERMKETLGADDEEWAIIAPRLEKVQTLARQAGGGGVGFLFGGRRGGGRRGPAPEQQGEQSAVEKAADSLRAVLNDETATAAQVKESLSAYREAREKARQELAKAQENLREVLSVKQEAQLVLMGLLE
ncbi:MAG: hypothetical protein AMK73_02595 [Planctomycetes bacterium SM23_32]|nr:MAG: hypothetical protein AMK73_02595 [Planctomycetes bacterium SM23_32]